ncbi:MAG TPA: hypothetical protein VD962_11405 [Rubricoccaceae bacterium]|nr:hypothetical protein [Rubricoccaceae bacterium]
MHPLLRPLLNRGGAGRYLSRAESVERLQPLVRQFNRLVMDYAAAEERLAGTRHAERLGTLAKALRTEGGKLFETVFSLGGKAPTGADLEPDADALGRSAADVLYHLLDTERAYHEALTEEVDAVHHQERTRAILGNVARGSAARLDALRELTARYPRRRA